MKSMTKLLAKRHDLVRMLCLSKGSFDDDLPHDVKVGAWFGSIRTAM
jgi:hypothetical protein